MPKISEFPSGGDPQNADQFVVARGTSNVKLLWSVIYSYLSTALTAVFDLLYAPIAKGVTNGDSHDHVGGDGAAIVEAAITLADNTTNNASTTKHGFLLKATAPAAGLLNVVGIGNGETVYANKAIFDTTNPAAIGTAASPGTSLIAARRDHVHAVTTVTADFTPTVEGTTTAGVGTYTVQTGRYSRVGNIIHFVLSLTWTAHTGTGNMNIAGLPVANENVQSSPVTITWSSITLAAVGSKLLGIILANSQTISLLEVQSGARSLLPLDTAGTLQISGTYFAG